jgi:hypothetical protein
MIARPMEDEFLSAVARFSGSTALSCLRELFRRVASCSRSWGIEIRGLRHPRLPDFGCAVAGNVPSAAWPVWLAEAKSFRLLRAVVSPCEVEGPWFFEFDATSGGESYTTDVHSFVRLAPALRPTDAIAERLAAARLPSELAKAATAIAALARRLRSAGCVSDLGVVMRSPETEIRLGLAVHASDLDPVLRSLVVHDALRDAGLDLVRRSTSDVLSTLQLGVSRHGEARLRGLELAWPARDLSAWRELLSVVVSRKWVDPAVAEAVAGWPGHARVSASSSRWPSVLARGVSHLKLCSADQTVSTRFYLVASEVFSLFA